MDRATADQISELIRLHVAELDSFRLQAVLETPLADFHHWANGKICTGAYSIATDDAELYLLLIQWSLTHRDRFHLVVYDSDRTGPVFEVHEVQNNHLRWAYRPAKRDGRNPERKTRFEALAKRVGLSMEDSRVAIQVPENATDLDQFLHTVFRLAKTRSDADDLSAQPTTGEPSGEPSSLEPRLTDQSNTPGTRYWLMALGPGAALWDECYRQGIACLGWDDIGNIDQYASRDDIPLGRNDSLACWQFCHEMQSGDTIFVKLGTALVVGHGTVTSDYRFDASRTEYKNVRNVDWHSTFPEGVPVRDKPLVQKTLTDVSKYLGQIDDLKRAVGLLPSHEESKPVASYSIDAILDEGCFLERSELAGLLARLKLKKNLILQGPPGTGKTWLAKRLSYALIGRRDRERICAVQFHPTLSYEDFVLGWRPSTNGLQLTKGIFLRAIESASADSGIPYVVVIEEINRGNPAQIFGELITLLEADKRTEAEAVELSYTDQNVPQRVHVPANLYVVGTMNIADRSLALVDLALRRRFAFATLKPNLGPTWHRWVTEELGMESGLADDVQRRIAGLNQIIEKSLGAQFCVGHSYVTPTQRLDPRGTRGWFRDVVETELAPLLEEYWFDDADRAKQERDRLLESW